MGRGKQDLSKKPYKDRSISNHEYYEKTKQVKPKKKKVRESQMQTPRVRDHAAEYEMRKSKNGGKNPTWSTKQAQNQKIARGKARNEFLKIQIANDSEEALSLDEIAVILFK